MSAGLLTASHQLWRWLPWPVPVLVVPAMLIYVAGPDLEDLLRYQRDSVLDAQIWRLFTGHLVHLGALHLALNALALWVIMAGFGGPKQPAPFRMSLSLLVLMLGVSLGLLLANPELQWYVGLSGVLHGLMILVAVWWVQGPVRAVLLVGLTVKIAWEQLTGGDALTADAIGGPVVVDAHLYGALTAVIWLTVEGFLSVARKRA